MLIQTQHANISNSENTLSNFVWEYVKLKKDKILRITNCNKQRGSRLGKKIRLWYLLIFFSLESTWYSALWYLVTPAAPVERQVWKQPGSVVTKVLFDWSRK